MFLNDMDRGSEKNHIIRIFKLPYFGNKRTDETELVYGYDVYVGVCEIDEEPECNVFYIGKVGEIKQIIWGKSFFDGAKDVTNIVLKTAAYSDNHYHYYPKYKIKRNIINLNITVNTIKITKN
jgi:hypothetical protein